MPIDEIDDQIAAYFGWLEDQLDVPMSYHGPVDAPRPPRRWPIVASMLVVAALAVGGVAFMRSSPERAVTVDDVPPPSVFEPPTTIVPMTIDPTTIPVVEPTTTWAPVNLPTGMQLIGVYRGLRDWPFFDSGIEVSDAEPYIAFMVLTADGSQIYMGDAVGPSALEQPASVQPQPIEGVGELRGYTLSTIDGSVFGIGFPLSGGRQASDDEILQIASAFAPVTETDLTALDRQARTTLLELPEISATAVGGYELVLRGPDPLHSVALCVRSRIGEDCKPDVGNLNREAYSRASVASTLVDGRWIIGAYNLRVPALCSARADGSAIAVLPRSTATVDGIEYFVVEVPADVNYARGCTVDTEPPSANTSAVMMRPESEPLTAP